MPKGPHKPLSPQVTDIVPSPPPYPSLEDPSLAAQMWRSSSEPLDFSQTINLYSNHMDLQLSELARSSRKVNRLPKREDNKQRFLQALHEAFEVIGGVPRLIHWADANYEEYVKLMGKSILPLVQQQFNIQNNQGGPVTIITAVGASPLDEIDDE